MINDRRKFLSLKYIRLLKVSNGRSKSKEIQFNEKKIRFECLPLRFAISNLCKALADVNANSPT
jgi:hypothetical protein